MRRAGSGLGSGGFVVYDDSACVVGATRSHSRFLALESCGQCPACAHGTEEITEALDRLERGEGSADDLRRLAARTRTVTGGQRCALPSGEAAMVGSLLERFEEEVREDLGRPCPRPRPLPGPTIVDFDEATGRFEHAVLPPGRSARARADLDSTPVAGFMTREVVTIGPDWQVEEAAVERASRRIRHLVVTEDGRVQGVVSIRDLLLAGRWVDLSGGHWAILRDPRTLTVRERRRLQSGGGTHGTCRQGDAPGRSATDRGRSRAPWRRGGSPAVCRPSYRHPLAIRRRVKNLAPVGASYIPSPHRHHRMRPSRRPARTGTVRRARRQQPRLLRRVGVRVGVRWPCASAG